MGYLIDTAVSFVAGVAVCWIYKSVLISKAEKELADLKSAAQRVIR
jgi:hypothetical protein